MNPLLEYFLVGGIVAVITFSCAGVFVLATASRGRSGICVGKCHARTKPSLWMLHTRVFSSPAARIPPCWRRSPAACT